MSKYKHIIIDGNNLYAANWFANKNLTVTYQGNVIITGGIYGFLRSLKRLEREYLEKFGKVYILFDNYDSKENYRKEIDPAYKKDRKKQELAYYQGLDLLQLILLSYSDNYNIVYGTSYEADDLVLPIQKYLRKHFPYDRMLMISEDADWARGIGNDTDWYAKKKIFTSILFEETFGYAPTMDSVIMYKSLRGDDSDGIPKGLANIREVTVIGLIKKYHNLHNMFISYPELVYIDKGKEKKLSDLWVERLHRQKSRIILNSKLVGFLPLSESGIISFMYIGKFRPEAILMYCNMLSIDPLKLDPTLAKHLPDQDFDDESFLLPNLVERAK